MVMEQLLDDLMLSTCIFDNLYSIHKLLNSHLGSWVETWNRDLGIANDHHPHFSPDGGINQYKHGERVSQNRFAVNIGNI